jgi:hypothetical protein
MAFAVVEDTFQVYLSSDGCLDTYPGNSPNNFSIILKRRKEFRGKNQKFAVGLALFGYDSAMFNLGENTGVNMTVTGAENSLNYSLLHGFLLFFDVNREYVSYFFKNGLFVFFSRIRHQWACEGWKMLENNV